MRCIFAVKCSGCASDSWFFDIWQPEEIDEAQCWPLDPDDNWHGFGQTDRDHMYLDPIKVTILTPGMNELGTLEEGSRRRWWRSTSTSAASWWKTGPYNLLFLFSIGIDKPRR